MSEGSVHDAESHSAKQAVADELAVELAAGRVEYVAKLIIASLTKDPYLRSPISDDWSWAEMRPYIQRLVDETVAREGVAARRWAEVSAEASRVIDSPADTAMNGQTARELSDVGTDLMNVLLLIDRELDARTQPTDDTG